MVLHRGTRTPELLACHQTYVDATCFLGGSNLASAPMILFHDFASNPNHGPLVWAPNLKPSYTRYIAYSKLISTLKPEPQVVVAQIRGPDCQPMILGESLRSL